MAKPLSRMTDNNLDFMIVEERKLKSKSESKSESDSELADDNPSESE